MYWCYHWRIAKSCLVRRVFVFFWAVFIIAWVTGRNNVMAQAEVGTGYYWNTEEHESYSSDSDVDRLFPWLEEYESPNTSFTQKTKVAFRFASHDSEMWWGRLALVAAEPELWDRHRDALVHLASACYTRLSGPESFSSCLASREPRVAQGALILLPQLRSLRMDGHDAAWPSDKLLDAQVLPYRASRVLHSHPALGVWVVRALAAYGPSAAAQAGELVPLLISEDAETASAAKSAIQTMDPEGIAQRFQLQNDVSLSADQRQQVKVFLANSSIPGPESCRHPRFAKQYEALLQFFRDRTVQTNLPKQDPAAEVRFLKSATPDEWWPVLIAASLDWDFREFHSAYLVSQMARTLYMEEGSPAVLARLLQSEDLQIAAGTVQLVSSMRHYRDGSSHYLDGDLIDPAGMPLRFANVLKQHPDLGVYVARGLAAYGTQSQSQSGAIVRYLQSDDPVVVWEIRRALTEIDPTLASALECQLDVEDFQDFLMEFAEASVLSSRQLELLQRHLDSRR